MATCWFVKKIILQLEEYHICLSFGQLALWLGLKSWLMFETTLLHRWVGCHCHLKVQWWFFQPLALITHDHLAREQLRGCRLYPWHSMVLVPKHCTAVPSGILASAGESRIRAFSAPVDQDCGRADHDDLSYVYWLLVGGMLPVFSLRFSSAKHEQQPKY